MSRTLSRRTALKTLGGGAGAVVLLPWLSEEGLAAFDQVQKARALPALRVLTPAQYATVDVLVEAIIPADENSPGAREARVADYVDLLLSESEPSVKEAWLEGLAALDAEAQERFGAPYARVDAPQADELLADISRGEQAAKPTVLEAFFTTTKQAAIRGYYTSEIGIHKELRYKGNQILAEFTGCHTQDGKDCPLCGQKAEG